MEQEFCEICGVILPLQKDTLCKKCRKHLEEMVAENRKYPAVPYKKALQEDLDYLEGFECPEKDPIDYDW